MCRPGTPPTAQATTSSSDSSRPRNSSACRSPRPKPAPKPADSPRSRPRSAGCSAATSSSSPHVPRPQLSPERRSRAPRALSGPTWAAGTCGAAVALSLGIVAAEWWPHHLDDPLDHQMVIPFRTQSVDWQRVHIRIPLPGRSEAGSWGARGRAWVSRGGQVNFSPSSIFSNSAKNAGTAAAPFVRPRPCEQRLAVYIDHGDAQGEIGLQTEAVIGRHVDLRAPQDTTESFGCIARHQGRRAARWNPSGQRIAHHDAVAQPRRGRQGEVWPCRHESVETRHLVPMGPLAR